MKAKRTAAAVTSTVVVRDRATRKEKHRETRNLERETDLPRMTGQQFVICKVGNGVKISMGYQSVEVIVGVDLPWPMRTKNMEDVKAGFDAAYNFVDDELSGRVKEMDGLLAKLAAKYRDQK